MNSEAQFLERPWNIADGSGQVNAKKSFTLKVGLYKSPGKVHFLSSKAGRYATASFQAGTGPKRACIIPSLLSLEYYLDTGSNIRTM